MRKSIAVGLSVLALGGIAGAASAADTDNYGPYASNSTDSGTCGNDWANDTMQRQYKVYPQQNVDGSYRVQQNFLKGHFTTIAGASPEACESASHTGHTLVNGVKGTFKGFFIMKVSSGTYSPAGASTCTAPCYTADFVLAAFGPLATYSVSDYWFKYHTRNAVACEQTWVNAATGNSGDIATDCP